MHTFRPQAASFGYFYYLCWAKYRYRMQPVNRTSDPQGQPVSTNLSATGFREPGFCNQVQPRIGKGSHRMNRTHRMADSCAEKC